MKITFTQLTESHFSLLLKWLEAPHVKAWWAQDIQWTPDLIQEKYTDYVKGSKLENGVAKAISAHIIYVDNTPIGYIQIYNAYDFARTKPLTELPSSLAAFDIFIGEKNYLKHGIGSKAIVQFLTEHCDSYTHIFVDPESTNLAAIRAYEKAGFKKIKEQPDTGEIWMILDQTSAVPKLIQQLELSLLDSSVRKSPEQLNKLIADDFLEFGSSGKIYNKKDCLEPDEKPRKFEVSDFKVKELSKDVMLATYKTIEDGAVSLRSSIWKQYGDEWQMIFHQGTKVQEAEYEHKQ
jgi:RimJ/RimL family protein N-acetyltransferase